MIKKDKGIVRFTTKPVHSPTGPALKSNGGEREKKKKKEKSSNWSNKSLEQGLNLSGS